jgi:ankyrin repeat-rich membrane spanning protein
MLDMVRCLDAFTGQQSRLVVVVDGLDSCEQPKVNSQFDINVVLYKY